MTAHLFALGLVSLLLGPSYPLSRYPDPISTGVVVSPTDDVAGRQVRFVSSTPSLLARRDEGGRMQRLLRSDDQCARRRARVGDG